MRVTFFKPQSSTQGKPVSRYSQSVPRRTTSTSLIPQATQQQVVAGGHDIIALKTGQLIKLRWRVFSCLEPTRMRPSSSSYFAPAPISASSYARSRMSTGHSSQLMAYHSLIKLWIRSTGRIIRPRARRVTQDVLYPYLADKISDVKLTRPLTSRTRVELRSRLAG